jgi:hypothetical protein
MPYPIGFRVCWPIARGLLPETGITGIICQNERQGRPSEDPLMVRRHGDQMAAIDAIGPDAACLLSGVQRGKADSDVGQVLRQLPTEKLWGRRRGLAPSPVCEID